MLGTGMLVTMRSNSNDVPGNRCRDPQNGGWQPVGQDWYCTGAAAAAGGPVLLHPSPDHEQLFNRIRLADR